MHTVTRFTALLSSFILVLAVGGCLAATTPGTKDSATKTAAKTSQRSSAAVSKSSQHAKESSAKSNKHVLSSAESLSGSIAFVGPSDKEVTLIGANGVPYDFQVNRKTNVDLAGQKIRASELGRENHKQATVRFLPTAQGNVAEDIEING